MPGVIRDKEYDLTQGNANSKIHYVSGNPNGEAEVVEVKLSASSTARKKVIEFDFAELEIKGRGARGNTITKYGIRKVDKIKEGTSTLSKLDLWYDPDSGRLNKDKRGKYLGKFDGDDRIIAFMRNGSYKITNYDLSNRYEPEKTLQVEKFNDQKPVSAIYVDGDSKQYMVKRFMVETSTSDKEFNFISETIGSRLILATTTETPEVQLEAIKGKGKEKTTETLNLEDLIDIKGWKALGNKLSQYKVVKVSLIQEEDSGPSDEVESEDEASEPEEEKQSPKKKEQTSEQQSQWPERAEQTSLFEEQPKKEPAPEKAERQKQKVEVVQQSLFPESPQKEKSKEVTKDTEKSGLNRDPDNAAINPQTGREFGVGETIELEI
jgi:topoisomerase-4 subunit A